MEEERTLKIAHVADLLTMKFNIPNYQRGYRWERKHVKALLDDLYEFMVQMDDTSNRQGKFYCIQPLAVVKNRELSSNDNIVYDVIDGQQRLTTIYLLLSYLEDARRILYSGKLATTIFSLQYESRNSTFFENKEFKKRDISEAISNIDFFYMTKAYQTIDAWFKEKGSAKSIILEVLIPKSYKDISQLSGEELEKVQRENEKENDVRFIWYEVPAKKNTDSIEVFSQLNYGKTPLTATELVKALLFQCDLYTEDTKLMREIAFRHSCEWDAMEKQLQDPFMWAMLMPQDYQPASHITLLFSLVCTDLYYNKLKEKAPEEVSKIQPDDSDFNYQVCKLYLGKNKDGDYANNVAKIWEKVQATYTTLYNWYKDASTYHLIGLLIWLKEFKNRNFDEQKRFELVRQLMDEYRRNTKQRFSEYLKEEIAKLIHVEEYKTLKEGKKIPWGLKRVNYNEDPDALIKILVTFNVEEMRRQQDESSRFSFDLLRQKEVTSLEHIHPQNLNLDNIKLDTLRTWLDVKEANLKQLDKFRDYAEDIRVLRQYIQDEDAYKNNISEAQKIINKIDQEFDDLAYMKESQMHTLYNMALVDKATNSALSNKLLDEKRKILIELHSTGKTYVLPSTHKVFSKYYSKATSENVLPKLWTQPDREAYFQAIEGVYMNYMIFYKG